jgi:hypothetical protein
LLAHRRQIEEKRIPCKAGNPEQVDSEYVRKGVADVFMMFEPLAGKHHAIVTTKRTAVNFAQTLKYTSDVLYPHAEKIVLVTDHLNTHCTASLYHTFEPTETHRLANRFEMALYT